MLVGIDIGTSSVKGALLTLGGDPVSIASRPTPWRASAGGSELDPDGLIATVEGVIADALEARAGAAGEVAAIGITGFAESGVMLDDSGYPCAPILPWHDDRGAEQEADLRLTFGDAEFARRTGQILRRRASLVKYRWLRERLGAAAGRGRWMPVPEWVVSRLGGDPLPELSQWSRTGFLSVSRGVVDEEVAAWAELPASGAPDPVVAGTPMGRVSGSGRHPSIRGAVLTSAGHDHLCAAFGAGAVGPDEVFDSWGNGEALLRARHRVEDPWVGVQEGVSVSWHVIPDSHLLFKGLGTGLVLRRVLGMLGVAWSEREALDAEAAATEPAAAPRLAMSPDGELDVLDVPEDCTPALVWRQALETAAARVRDALERIEQLWGPVSSVAGCGGWLASEPLRELRLRQIEGYRVAAGEQPGAIGAALLAGRAAGIELEGPAATGSGSGSVGR